MHFKKTNFQPSYSWVVLASLILGIIVIPPIFSNISNLSYSLSTGRINNTTPAPLYGFVHLQTDKPDYKDNTFAGDFAVIYMPAKHFEDPDLYTGKYEANNTIPYYPPFLIFLLSKTLANIVFPIAVLLHIAIQVILLLLVSYFVLRYYALDVFIMPVSLIYFMVLFLNPVGLSWFERGQFEIYPAISILLFIFAAFENKWYIFVLAALFASLKWTVMPFFCQALPIYLLFNYDHRKLRCVIIFIATILLTLIFFGQYSLMFLSLIYKAQASRVLGFTLAQILPSKALTGITIASAVVYIVPLLLNRKRNMCFYTFLPYMTGLAVLDVILPSISWEYRLISIIGFIPMVIVWANKSFVNQIYKWEFLSFFSLICFFGFHGFWIFSEVPAPIEYMLCAYLAYYFAVSTISISRCFEI